jgi:hypothetical protein
MENRALNELKSEAVSSIWVENPVFVNDPLNELNQESLSKL